MTVVWKRLLWITLCVTVVAQDSVLFTHEAVHHPVIARNGMVATQQYLATEAGLAVLEEGGNAVDAAVTIGFVLAVTLPRAGNLGGGGFMLIHDAESQRTVAVDYRERAPAAARREMYWDENGQLDRTLSTHSYLAVGVPGTVAGLLDVLDKYGTITRQRALQPAIEFAKKGFLVDEEFALSLAAAKERMRASPAAMAVFFKPDGGNYIAGERLHQRDLAWSLQQIATKGKAGFYDGELAKRLIKAIQAGGGIMTLSDLKAYKPTYREPVRGTYRGVDVVSMPPPSSGGVHLIQMLNMLEGYDLGAMGHNRARTVHLMAESMRRAYADRFKHLGDTDFVAVPLTGLLSKEYAAQLRESIKQYRATPSDQVGPGNPVAFHESNDTTHFSVMDGQGNVVSNTYTLNFSYGTKLMAADTGILLNNEMDDFATKPGEPDSFGLIGGEKNAIEPGKRMLSSMTPTILFKDGKPYLATGSPGGSRIITAVLQIVLNVVDHGLNIAEATHAPRVHHQWFPDSLRVERGISGDTLDLLRALGHEVQVGHAMASTQSVMCIDGVFYGSSDPRRPGAETKGH